MKLVLLLATLVLFSACNAIDPCLFDSLTVTVDDGHTAHKTQYINLDCPPPGSSPASLNEPADPCGTCIKQSCRADVEACLADAVCLDHTGDNYGALTACATSHCSKQCPGLQ